mmetsp:Transcript_34971/g.77785  ORF Transcript_34971/g.77785 Transcript_34971/m.77785 type:complete len:110 (-) Transcript_34971:10-339(-)
MRVDSMKVYNLPGPRFRVEMYIILPPDMTLGDAQHIAEEMQMKLAALPEVEQVAVRATSRAQRDGHTTILASSWAQHDEPPHTAQHIEPHLPMPIMIRPRQGGGPGAGV